VIYFLFILLQLGLVGAGWLIVREIRDLREMKRLLDKAKETNKDA
jgi:hypothetical protein